MHHQDDTTTSRFASLDEYVGRLGGNRVIRKVLIANNGIAAVKAIRFLRKWAYEALGNEREVCHSSRRGLCRGFLDAASLSAVVAWWRWSTARVRRCGCVSGVDTVSRVSGCRSRPGRRTRPAPLRRVFCCRRASSHAVVLCRRCCSR
jgi:hypothetical protein